MVDVAQSDEVVSRIRSPVFVVLDVVELQHLARIIGRQHGSVPSALNALEAIAMEDGDADGVRDGPVVFVGLSVLFKNIDPDGQVLPPAVPGDYRPAIFGAEFTDVACPFLLVLCEILQLFASDLFAHVSAKVLDDFVFNRDSALADIVQHVPAVRSSTVLLLAHQDVLVRSDPGGIDPEHWAVGRRDCRPISRLS